MKGADLQKQVGEVCAALARFAWVCCGREPGAEAWLERMCLSESAGVGHTVSKLGSQCCSL